MREEREAQGRVVKVHLRLPVVRVVERERVQAAVVARREEQDGLPAVDLRKQVFLLVVVTGRDHAGGPDQQHVRGERAPLLHSLQGAQDLPVDAHELVHQDLRLDGLHGELVLHVVVLGGRRGVASLGQGVHEAGEAHFAMGGRGLELVVAHVPSLIPVPVRQNTQI